MKINYINMYVFVVCCVGFLGRKDSIVDAVTLPKEKMARKFPKMLLCKLRKSAKGAKLAVDLGLLHFNIQHAVQRFLVVQVVKKNASANLNLLTRFIPDSIQNRFFLSNSYQNQDFHADLWHRN